MNVCAVCGGPIYRGNEVHIDIVTMLMIQNGEIKQNILKFII